MKTLDLDALLGDAHPEATFHDSQLVSLSVAFERGTAELKFRVQIWEDESEVVYRAGTLTLVDLLFFAMEPPRRPLYEYVESPLWITSEGSFPGDAVKSSIQVPSDLPDDAFCHYLFARNAHAFIVVAALDARFAWSDG